MMLRGMESVFTEQIFVNFLLELFSMSDCTYHMMAPVKLAMAMLVNS